MSYSACILHLCGHKAQKRDIAASCAARSTSISGRRCATFSGAFNKRNSGFTSRFLHQCGECEPRKLASIPRNTTSRAICVSIASPDIAPRHVTRLTHKRCGAEKYCRKINHRYCLIRRGFHGTPHKQGGNSNSVRSTTAERPVWLVRLPSRPAGRTNSMPRLFGFEAFAKSAVQDFNQLRCRRVP